MSAAFNHGLRLAVKPRPRGLVPWAPQKATWALIEQVQRVLEEYSKYLPLAIRQIFYRLIGVHGYPKRESDYGRLCEVLNRSRRAGIIPFDAIRDDSANIVVSLDWDSDEALVSQWRSDVEHFRLNRQHGQPRRLLIMVEAAGMQPQIAAAVRDWSIPVIPSGGFDSLTAKKDLAQAIGSYDGLTEVLHIGDHDPSGAHLFLSMAEDVEALIRDLGLLGEVTFTRLAVTPAQITALSLPTAPPKVTDRRAFDGETVQCEAIPPDVLVDIVTAAVRARIDQDVLAVTLARETRSRTSLIRQLDGITRNNGENDA